MTPEEKNLPINATVDAERAHHLVRAFSREAGLPERDIDELLLATSELLRNVLIHATSGGSLSCRRLEIDGEQVVQVEVKDSGPGIPDIELAMHDGYTSGSGLGSGLPTARRHVDTFAIESGVEGTAVRLRKRIRLK